MKRSSLEIIAICICYLALIAGGFACFLWTLLTLIGILKGESGVGVVFLYAVLAAGFAYLPYRGLVHFRIMKRYKISDLFRRKAKVKPVYYDEENSAYPEPLKKKYHPGEVGYSFPIKSGSCTILPGRIMKLSGTGTLIKEQGTNTYAAYSKLPARILIRGFDHIEKGAFEFFTDCEEVFFDVPFVKIDSLAFAHCYKLSKITFKGECDVADDAFADTPYLAETAGIPYVPEYVKGEYIVKGEYGSLFLAEIRYSIASYRNIGAFKLFPANDGRNYVFNIDTIRKGAKAKEPAMLYLFAELMNYSYVESKNKHLANFTKQELAVPVRDWYLLAAANGSPHAQLWCIYCMERGIEGFEKDPAQAKQILAQFRENLQDVDLTELAFFDLEISSLSAQIDDAGRFEDLYTSINCSTSEFWRQVPGVSQARSRDVMRAVAFSAAVLGLTYAPQEEMMNSANNEEYEELLRHIIKTKKPWKKWFAECVRENRPNVV